MLRDSVLEMRKACWAGISSALAAWLLAGCFTSVGAGSLALATLAHNSGVVEPTSTSPLAVSATASQYCARAPTGYGCLCAPMLVDCQARVDDLAAHGRAMNACAAATTNVCAAPRIAYCTVSTNGRAHVCESALDDCASRAAHITVLGGR